MCSMADLTCSVNTCASHNGGYCCRRAIEIHGPGAAMKDETFCWLLPAPGRGRGDQFRFQLSPEPDDGSTLHRRTLRVQRGRPLHR